MHAGLLRPDSAPAPALAEAAQVAHELAEAPDVPDSPGDVALVFDYESAWAWATQPQGADFDYFRLCFAWYRACRRLGLNIDILPPDTADLSRWNLVLAPGLFTLGPTLHKALATCTGAVVLGPRSNSKTPDFAIPLPLPPDLPGLDARVVRVESLPPGSTVPLSGGGAFVHWAEEIEGSAEVALSRADGSPAMLRKGGVHYLAGWPEDETLRKILRDLCAAQGIETLDLPEGLRKRDAGPWRFWFNHDATAIDWQGHRIGPADLKRERRG